MVIYQLHIHLLNFDVPVPTTLIRWCQCSWSNIQTGAQTCPKAGPQVTGYITRTLKRRAYIPWPCELFDCRPKSLYLHAWAKRYYFIPPGYEFYLAESDLCIIMLKGRHTICEYHWISIRKNLWLKLGPWSDRIHFGQSYGYTTCSQKSLTAGDSSLILSGRHNCKFEKSGRKQPHTPLKVAPCHLVAVHASTLLVSSCKSPILWIMYLNRARQGTQCCFRASSLVISRYATGFLSM